MNVIVFANVNANANANVFEPVDVSGVVAVNVFEPVDVSGVVAVNVNVIVNARSARWSYLGLTSISLSRARIPFIRAIASARLSLSLARSFFSSGSVARSNSWYWYPPE